MRSPSAPAEVLAGVAGWRPVVSSWLGTENLESNVPVLSGRFSVTASQAVPEKLTFQVPRWDGRDWLPEGDPRHPLARFGQELAGSIVVSSSVPPTEWETRTGRVMVTNWGESEDGGEVSVTAAGMLRRAETDLLTTPIAPRTGGTLMSEFRRLLPQGLSAGFHPSLSDRACPRAMEWAEDRLGALYEIADTLPALLRTDAWGQIQLLPPLPDVPKPVLTLTHGERGTLVSAPRSDTQEGTPNRIIVRSSAQGKEAIQAVVDQKTGPMRVGGPYPTVAEVFTSPLITSVSQAVSTGRTVLARKMLASRTITVTCVPDPRIELDDPLEVITEDGHRYWGFVTGYDLPLTVNDGPMRIDLGVTS